MKNFILLISFLVAISFSLSGQNNDKVIYDKNYKFNEGIFLNFNQVLENSPIPLSNILIDLNKTDFNFFEQLLEEEEITYIDEFGTKVTCKSDDIWGYSTNSKLYIYWEQNISLVPVIGSICHFVGAYVYNDYSYNNDPFGYQNEPTKRVETRQYIIDANTGEVYNFNYRDIDILFSNDIELYEEWSDLSKRKKKKKIFVFLRNYNQRNPLYLPANN